LPASGPASPVKLEGVSESEWILPLANANVAGAYTIFARAGANIGDRDPEHAEFLIDRNDYIRTRWIGIPDAKSNRMAELRTWIETLGRERQRPRVVERHGH